MIRPHRSDPGDAVRPPPDLPGAAARGGGRSDWLLLGGAFSAFTVSAGLMHSYAVFLVAFIQDFAWSRAETSVPIRSRSPSLAPARRRPLRTEN